MTWENTVSSLYPHVETHRYTGPTVLYYFIQGTRASMDFGIHWGPGINLLQIPLIFKKKKKKDNQGSTTVAIYY